MTTPATAPMGPDGWAEVDSYLNGLLVGADEVLDEALSASTAAGLPAINVAPNQGKLLHLLARIQGARRILEIGTLGGYSTIWLARALPPDGRLTTLELDPRHAEVARDNLARAGLSGLVDVRVGPALQSVRDLADSGEEPYDFVFIDADKVSNADYVREALRVCRAGSVIVVDNVVRQGCVIDSSSDDPSVTGTRRLHEMLSAEPRLSATAVQTVGSKGHDGFVLAVVLPPR